MICRPSGPRASGSIGSRFSFQQHELMHSYIALVAIVISAATPLRAAESLDYVEQMGRLIERGGSPMKLEKSQTATTKAVFTPPVDIIIEAKTDSTDLRMSYAANQVIFNWSNGRNELRVDGGPANGKHKPGAGLIPANK